MTASDAATRIPSHGFPFAPKYLLLLPNLVLMQAELSPRNGWVRPLEAMAPHANACWSAIAHPRSVELNSPDAIMVAVCTLGVACALGWTPADGRRVDSMVAYCGLDAAAVAPLLAPSLVPRSPSQDDGAVEPEFDRFTALFGRIEDASVDAKLAAAASRRWRLAAEDATLCFRVGAAIARRARLPIPAAIGYNDLVVQSLQRSTVARIRGSHTWDWGMYVFPDQDVRDAFSLRVRGVRSLALDPPAMAATLASECSPPGMLANGAHPWTRSHMETSERLAHDDRLVLEWLCGFERFGSDRTCPATCARPAAERGCILARAHLAAHIVSCQLCPLDPPVVRATVAAAKAAGFLMPSEVLPLLMLHELAHRVDLTNDEANALVAAEAATGEAADTALENLLAPVDAGARARRRRTLRDASPFVERQQSHVAVGFAVHGMLTVQVAKLRLAAGAWPYSSAARPTHVTLRILTDSDLDLIARALHVAPAECVEDLQMLFASRGVPRAHQALADDAIDVRVGLYGATVRAISRLPRLARLTIRADDATEAVWCAPLWDAFAPGGGGGFRALRCLDLDLDPRMHDHGKHGRRPAIGPGPAVDLQHRRRPATGSGPEASGASGPCPEASGAARSSANEDGASSGPSSSVAATAPRPSLATRGAKRRRASGTVRAAARLERSSVAGSSLDSASIASAASAASTASADGTDVDASPDGGVADSPGPWRWIVRWLARGDQARGGLSTGPGSVPIREGWPACAEYLRLAHPDAESQMFAAIADALRDNASLTALRSAKHASVRPRRLPPRWRSTPPSPLCASPTRRRVSPTTRAVRPVRTMPVMSTSRCARSRLRSR